jgi:hypothetical protein
MEYAEPPMVRFYMSQFEGLTPEVSVDKMEAGKIS